MYRILYFIPTPLSTVGILLDLWLYIDEHSDLWLYLDAHSDL